MKHSHLMCLAASAFALFAVGCSSSSSDAGTTDTGTPGTDTAGTDTAGGGTPTCDAYCSLITKNCAADNAQYIDNDTCLKMCAKMDVGKAADTTGDTLGCRSYHAGAASGDAKLHCPHAGPYGGGMCGASRCDDFCKLAISICGGVSGATFADNAACLTECKSENADPTKKEIDSSAVGFTACTQYHLEAASKDTATHCGHLSTKAGPCKAP